MPRRRLAVGDLVTVELHINKWAGILIEMDLLGEDDEPLEGVRCNGTIRRVLESTVSVECPAVEETFEWYKTDVQPQLQAPTLYTVVDNEVKTLEGLHLPETFIPESRGYYSQYHLAQAELPPGIVAANAAAAAAESTAAAPAVTPQTRRKRRLTGTGSRKSQRRRSTPRSRSRPTSVHSDGSGDDEWTDDGTESESSHDDEELQWDRPATFERQAGEDDRFKALGEAVWTAPAKRGSVPDQPTGPDQVAEFKVDCEGGVYLTLFLDALPLRSFWERTVAKQSTLYWKQKTGATTPPTTGGRAASCNGTDFTPSAYLRLCAAVIMRGLVKCSDDPTFYAGEQHGAYRRTGATEMCGLTLTKAQQLMRFMHLADNEKRASVEDDDHDRCFHIRPLITHLQDAFRRWIVPGKNNAMDEAGIPSKMRWLRHFNKDKPNKYYIEVLMACDSITRFCWGFIVNEKSTKNIRRQSRSLPAGVTRGRGRRQTKLEAIRHYQYEYDDEARALLDDPIGGGPAAAQIVHFASMLRSFDPEPESSKKTITYRLFMDRRWDSLYGHHWAMTEHQVSCCATVKKGSRFHVASDDYFPSMKGPNGWTKRLENRGKYRSVTTTVQGITFNAVLWADSKLTACVSADLGTAEVQVNRKCGRHVKAIPCPKMIAERSKYFRAVDLHDQLRLGKWHFNFITRKKPWQKVFWALIEILLVNIFIVAKQSNPDLNTQSFRWALVQQLLERAKSDDGPVTITSPSTATTTPTRWNGGKDCHHFDRVKEYVDPDELPSISLMMSANPCTRPSGAMPRRRDSRRRDGKVKNPAFTGGAACIVCKFHKKMARPPRVVTYCRECQIEPHWPFITRATGFKRDFYPRLCSRQCWDIFHTMRIPSLDNPRQQVRRKMPPRNQR